MALRFIDGFNHYATAQIARKWTTEAVGTAVNREINAAEGVGGSQCYKITDFATSGAVEHWLGKTLDAQATWIVGFNFKYAAAVAPTRPVAILRLVDGSTVHVDLQLNGDGTLAVSRNNTVLGTSTASLAANVYGYVEYKATIADSGGSYEVRVNGISVLSGTGDTRNGGNATANVIRLGYQRPTGSGTDSAWDTFHFDDVYICDGTGSTNNDFLGPMRVTALYPTGAGSSAQWTPSTGANWAAVDEALVNDDTDYVSSSTAGHVDTHALGDLPAGVTSVKGLQTVIAARKDDAGSRTIARVLRSGGANYDGASVGVGDTYSVYHQVAETDPATGLAWTRAGVNALEAGVRLVS